MSFVEKNAFKILLFWCVILGCLYSTLSLLRHNHFQSGGFDLGLYDQTIWLYSQFQFPYNTIKDRFALGDHLNLTLPLLAPLFYLWDNIRILLIFQAFWLSLSSLAIFKITRKQNLSSLTALNLSFIYSLFYGIQQAIFFDFHPITLGVGLLIWLAWFWESQQNRLFLLTLILLLLTQENMGIALICLSLTFIFRKKFFPKAVFLIFIGLIVTLLAPHIITLFSPVGFQYQPIIKLNLISLASDLFSSPEKRQVWLYSFSWFSFLPLLSPGAILAIVLDLAQYFVTGPEFSRMWSPFMHHRAILAPLLTLGTINTLVFLKKIKFNPQTLSFLLIVVTLSLQYYFHFPLNKLSKPIYWQNESWMDDNHALFKLIPSHASLVTQQNLVPHLSHREKIYLAWPRIHDRGWWLDFGDQPEYLVVDLHPNQWLTQLLESNENFQTAVNNMERTGKITLKQAINYAKLYYINY
jgi:uncharacterized membrane protein